MSLPEKYYFKINEVVERWKTFDSSCSFDQIIQFGATNSLAMHCFFNNYLIAEGIYKGTLPINNDFGRTILQILQFDKNYNNTLCSIFEYSTIDNRYHFNFNVYKKDHVKVCFIKLGDDWDKPPTLLKLGQHYDVNTRNNYVELFVPLSKLYKIGIFASYADSFSELNAYQAKDFEQLRSEDIKLFIKEEKVRIEYLQAKQEKNYFKCLIDRNGLPLPWISKDDLYISKKERNRFEQENCLIFESDSNSTLITSSEIPKIQPKKNENEHQEIGLSYLSTASLSEKIEKANDLHSLNIGENSESGLIKGLKIIKNDMAAEGIKFTLGNLIKWILDHASKDDPGNNNLHSLDKTGFDNYYICLIKPKEKKVSKMAGKLHWKDEYDKPQSRKLRSLERIIKKV